MSLPLGVATYYAEILGVEKTFSKQKNHPMLKVDAQLTGNQPRQFNGETVDVNGVSINFTIMLVDEWKDYGRGYNKLCRAAKLPVPPTLKHEEVNPADFKNKKVQLLLRVKDEEMKNEYTNEPVINLETGKPITTPRTEVDQIIA